MRFLRITVLTIIVLLLYNETADARQGLFSRMFFRRTTTTAKQTTYRRPAAKKVVEKEIELPPAPVDIQLYSKMLAEGNPRRYSMVYETPPKKRINYEIF